MLKDLHIKNLVLMQSCCIEFKEGLTILTGETGSGKSAILHGLKLLLGQKLDTSLIRWGEKKGSIQARFEVNSTALLDLLKEINVETEDSTLILYREISTEGKSKNFINDKMVSLSLLQKVGSHLVQIVDQTSHHELRAQDRQRELLDLFGSLEKEVALFGSLFEENKQRRLEEKKLEEKEQKKERELTFCLEQQKELSSLQLKEGEEDLLFQEYTLFSKSQEILEKTDQLCNLLSEGSHSTLATANRSKTLLDSLASYHETFLEPAELLKQSLLSLDEALHLLRQASSTFEVNPKHLAKVEEKLGLIHRMKKKYGTTPADWELYKKELEEKIADFDALDENKKMLKLAIDLGEEQLSLLEKELTQKRIQTAKKLSSSLQKELNSLNMIGTKVDIRIAPQNRSQTGKDAISFWLEANTGEAPVSIKEHSSGGELSRLLLALKLSLAEKNNTPTLIFDEIDANVGGKTAKMIGEKLLTLSSHHQVICITHFPQVASLASHHLLVRKAGSDNRTFSTVESLDPATRQIELLRMLGGKELRTS
ncbi:MAG: DNA repair protein RecN [Chlamydiota bacterium]